MSPAKPPLRTFLGLPKLPARFAGIVIPVLLSVLMTFIVSMVSTLSSMGLTKAFISIWFIAWGLSWLDAFPTLLLVLPLVRRATAAIVDVA
jgi:hypothetical protein